MVKKRDMVLNHFGNGVGPVCHPFTSICHRLRVAVSTSHRTRRAPIRGWAKTSSQHIRCGHYCTTKLSNDAFTLLVHLYSRCFYPSLKTSWLVPSFTKKTFRNCLDSPDVFGLNLSKLSPVMGLLSLRGWDLWWQTCGRRDCVRQTAWEGILWYAPQYSAIFCNIVKFKNTYM